MFKVAKQTTDTMPSSHSEYETTDDEQGRNARKEGDANEPKKKKRPRGRRRKGKSRNKVEPVHKKLSNNNTKKHHDAPMKKKDLYFALTCAMVGIKGGGSVVARVVIVNFDLETVLDTFVSVPVPVVDFQNSGVTPRDIQKSRTNANVRSFSEVRQLVDQTLRGKILIGHQLAEHLTALGLTHPSQDTRDTATFFKKEDLSNLTQTLIRKTLPDHGDAGYAIESCIAALEIYKTNRQQWEEDLIKQAQANQQQRMMMQRSMDQPTMNTSQYNCYHTPQGQPQGQGQRQQHPRARTHSFENTHEGRIQGYPHGTQTHMPPQHYQDNSSWFIRGHPNEAGVQQAPTPALSSRAMKVLSSTSYPLTNDDMDRASSVSYESSTLHESSTDYTGSFQDGSSVLSDSVATVSVASWQEEDATEGQGPSQSSSWFRFGSRKKAQRRMSAVSEEREDEVIAATMSEDLDLQSTSPHGNTQQEEGNQYHEDEEEETMDDSTKQSSWFGFRRSKSPSMGKQGKFSEDDELNSSRFHAAADLELFPLEIKRSSDSTPSNATTQPSSLDEEAINTVANSDLENLESNMEKSSSWFSFRRSKGQTMQKSTSTSNATFPEPTESTYTGDEDWLQEVMDSKPPGKDLQGETSSSSNWFRFMRASKTTRSRLPSLDDEALEAEVAASFEETGNWIGEAMSTNNASEDDWERPSHAAGGLFFPASRPRLPTESTIQTIATEEIDEDSGSLSQDLLDGMEQNLAFLNI